MFIKQVLVLSLLAVELAPEGLAAETRLGFGQGFIEGGDFVLHPAVQANLELPSTTRFRLNFSGRRYGSFLETTSLVTWEESLELFPWEQLKARLGVSFLDQYIAYDPPGAPSEQSHDLNLGLALGLDWEIYSYDRYHLKAEWNAHLFAAGFAFLVLTTARKSTMTIGVEASL